MEIGMSYAEAEKSKKVYNTAKSKHQLAITKTSTTQDTPWYKKTSGLIKHHQMNTDIKVATWKLCLGLKDKKEICKITLHITKLVFVASKTRKLIWTIQ